MKPATFSRPFVWSCSRSYATCGTGGPAEMDHTTLASLLRRGRDSRHRQGRHRVHPATLPRTPSQAPARTSALGKRPREEPPDVKRGLVVFPDLRTMPDGRLFWRDAANFTEPASFSG